VTFPRLKTGAVAQYPGRRIQQFQNQALRFVDGAEQRYRDSSCAVHEWEVALEQLEEGEMAALEGFFAANRGEYGSFEFTDPWDGRVYADCSLAGDGADFTNVGEMKCRTVLRIRENRS
jgi:hypothetical protein